MSTPLRGAALQAVLDRVLPTVTKPARYVGNELNTVIKPEARARVAIAFPDIYDIGMSSFGLQLLYAIVNQQPDFAAERVFQPWMDMEAVMRREGIPLYSLETRRPLHEFEMVAFMLSYELHYTDVLNMLDLGGVPIRSADRDSSHPLIAAGGHCVFNPEPLAPFLDCAIIGDAEEALVELTALVAEERERRNPAATPAERRAERRRLLLRAAGIDGIYVPEFYDVTYKADGTLKAITPNVPQARFPVEKRTTLDLDAAIAPTKPIIPLMGTVQDRAMIEIQRGCTRGCRFCQAGMVTRPTRERSAHRVIEIAEQLLANTGYDELGLLSLSAADHSEIQPMVGALVEQHGQGSEKVSVSLPSLRVDSFSIELAKSIEKTRKSGFTFAPEAGTQRLRDVINKNVTEEDLIRSAEGAYSEGWQTIKLYFVTGLPTETDEDILGIADLVKKVIAIGQKYHGRRAKVRASASVLVPKPQTPFQWLSQDDQPTIEHKQRLLQDALRRPGIEFSWHDYTTSFWEAVLCQGDRRVADCLETLWRNGSRLDAWTENFDQDRWLAAFAEHGIDPHFHVNRAKDRHEVLPWEHITCGVTKEWLWEDYERSIRAKTVQDCADGACSLCGVSELPAEDGPGGAVGCPIPRQHRLAQILANRKGIPLRVV